MRRKSAYILFLAVLGLLVIGIVMLFSTSAYARDSHGDVYFFIKRQAIWIGLGLVGMHFCGAHELSVLAEDVVALVRAGAGCSDALLHPAHRNAHQRIASLGRLRPYYFSAVGTRKDSDDHFSCRLVCAT